MVAPDPWNTRAEDYWSLRDPEARARFLLNYAVLAPSPFNTQPWLFSVKGSQTEIYADRKRGLEVSDPEDRQLVIACGSALYYLQTAMRRFGRRPIVRTFPDLNRPDLLAIVSRGPSREPTPSDLRAFEAMLMRHAQTDELDDRAPQAGLLQTLISGFSNMRGLRVSLVDDSSDRRAVAALIFESVKTQLDDSRYLKEREKWSSGEDQPGTRPDRECIRLGRPILDEGKFVTRVADGGPAMMVLASRNDSTASRLEAGQAVAELLLAAAGLGLSAKFHNEPLEVPEFRDRIDLLVGVGRRVQSIIQFGYAAATTNHVRRPVNEVLLNVF